MTPRWDEHQLGAKPAGGEHEDTAGGAGGEHGRHGKQAGRWRRILGLVVRVLLRSTIEARGATPWLYRRRGAGRRVSRVLGSNDTRPAVASALRATLGHVAVVRGKL